MAAFFVLLRASGVSPDWQIVTALAAFVLGIVCLVRLASRLMRKLIWRLRNRLIVAYLFIAVVPIVLILTLAYAAGYVLVGQVAAYFVRTACRPGRTACCGRPKISSPGDWATRRPGGQRRRPGARRKRRPGRRPAQVPGPGQGDSAPTAGAAEAATPPWDRSRPGPRPGRGRHPAGLHVLYAPHPGGQVPRFRDIGHRPGGDPLSRGFHPYPPPASRMGARQRSGFPAGRRRPAPLHVGPRGGNRARRRRGHRPLSGDQRCARPSWTALEVRQHQAAARRGRRDLRTGVAGSARAGPAKCARSRRQRHISLADLFVGVSHRPDHRPAGGDRAHERGAGHHLRAEARTAVPAERHGANVFHRRNRPVSVRRDRFAVDRHQAQPHHDRRRT